MVEFKATDTDCLSQFPILQTCGNRFLKAASLFQSKGTFLSSLIALIYYSYNGNLSTQFSQSFQYKQTFYELTEEVGIFSACLSYGRIISKKGKGPFQTFPLLINEAIFRLKNKYQIQLNTESRKIRFNYNLNTEHSPQITV